MSDRFDPSTWTGPFYATITEANVVAAQNVVGVPWEFTGPTHGQVGGEVTMSVEGGVDLIGRIDAIEDGRMTGVIVKVEATPPPVEDWDED